MSLGLRRTVRRVAPVLLGLVLLAAGSSGCSRPVTSAGAAPSPGSGATVAVSPVVPPTEGPATPAAPARAPDVPYVPTPQEVVDRMLELAQVKKGDVVYDLGCGDGRIVVTAAKKFGCRAVGLDIDQERVWQSWEQVRIHGLENLVTIRQEDLLTADLRQATVVTLYLSPEVNAKLLPQLEKLRPGTRIISHQFDIPGVKPAQAIGVTPAGGVEHVIYLWTVPFEKE